MWWRGARTTYCIALLVRACVYKASPRLSVLHNHYYYRQRYFVYIADLFIFAVGNDYSVYYVCLRLAGWRTYFDVPLVPVDGVIKIYLENHA